MSKITKPMGVTRDTSQMILLYLEAVKRPARTSEVRKAVVKYSPEAAAPIYGCLGDLMQRGAPSASARRVTCVERLLSLCEQSIQ
jgi:hypothetical protein